MFEIITLEKFRLTLITLVFPVLKFNQCKYNFLDVILKYSQGSSVSRSFKTSSMDGLSGNLIRNKFLQKLSVSDNCFTLRSDCGMNFSTFLSAARPTAGIAKAGPRPPGKSVSAYDQSPSSLLFSLTCRQWWRGVSALSNRPEGGPTMKSLFKAAVRKPRSRLLHAGAGDGARGGRRTAPQAGSVRGDRRAMQGPGATSPICCSPG